MTERNEHDVAGGGEGGSEGRGGGEKMEEQENRLKIRIATTGSMGWKRVMELTERRDVCYHLHITNNTDLQ
jgi:hypothetical protein